MNKKIKTVEDFLYAFKPNYKCGNNEDCDCDLCLAIKLMREQLKENNRLKQLEYDLCHTGAKNRNKMLRENYCMQIDCKKNTRKLTRIKDTKGRGLNK
jgi:hypothetical protein